MLIGWERSTRTHVPQQRLGCHFFSFSTSAFILIDRAGGAMCVYFVSHWILRRPISHTSMEWIAASEPSAGQTNCMCAIECVYRAYSNSFFLLLLFCTNEFYFWISLVQSQWCLLSCSSHRRSIAVRLASQFNQWYNCGSKHIQSNWSVRPHLCDFNVQLQRADEYDHCSMPCFQRPRRPIPGWRPAHAALAHCSFSVFSLALMCICCKFHVNA